MIDLKILIIDTDSKIAGLLRKIVETYAFVDSVDIEDPVNSLHQIANGNYNTIIIDPFARGLKFTSALIFKIRKDFPKIVFTLFSDFPEIENSINFYEGERKRFRHYFKLNKRTPLYLLEGDLISVLFACQNYLMLEGTDKKMSSAKEKIYNEYVELSFEVKKLISVDKLPQALEKMEVYYRERDNEIHKGILLMMLKMTNAENDKNKNLIEYSDYIKLKMQVANSAIEIINEKQKN